MEGVRALGRTAALAALLCSLAGFSAPAFDSRILFARGTPVPPRVQSFAWRVIEERCGYQGWERDRRSFWAYETRARAGDQGTVYAIRIVSDLGWRKTTPSEFIAITIVDDGTLRLTAIESSFIRCAL
jgi:hypothetical protein